MIVRQHFTKPTDDDDPPLVERVACRVCGEWCQPWVVNCCERCGRSGKAREMEVRLYLEEQAKENAE